MNTYGYVSSNPLRYGDPSGLITIFIGGAGDKQPFMGTPPHHIVGNYQNWYSNNVDSNSAYFGYNEKDKILAAIRAARANNPCEPINLVGHSYGGDTAAVVARALADDGVRTNALITVDPVGGAIPGFWDDGDHLTGVDLWSNINATPANRNASDTVASIGGKWGNAVNGEADLFANVNANHADFRGLFHGSNNGFNTLNRVKDNGCMCK